MPDQKMVQVNDRMVLDVEKTILSRDGVEIRLTPKEAKLMAILMENAGRVVSRKELMQAVWHSDYQDDNRTLDVHICWLRQKIEDDPAIPEHILTRHGLGYELRV